jgi:hypothetical protein
MTTYFLQKGVTDSSWREYKRGDKMTPPEPREFIDDHKHEKAEVIAGVEADHWTQAKAEILPW